MKYCPICKVDVNSKHKNCPLCGAFLEQNSPLPFERYEKEMEPIVSFPKVDATIKVDYLKSKNNLILILIAAICITMNILINPSSWWSAYVCIGLIFTILCVLRPISLKSKIYIQILTDVPIITALSIMTEFVITKFTSNAITVGYLLPSFYIAAIVLTDFMIIFTRKQRTSGYFTTLLTLTVFAILPQLFCWIILPVYQTWVVFIVFFAALLNLGIVVVTCNLRIREESIRKWNL